MMRLCEAMLKVKELGDFDVTSDNDDVLLNAVWVFLFSYPSLIMPSSHKLRASLFFFFFSSAFPCLTKYSDKKRTTYTLIVRKLSNGCADPLRLTFSRLPRRLAGIRELPGMIAGGKGPYKSSR